MQKNFGYKKFVVDSRLRYFKPHAVVTKTFAEEISSGLGSDPKSIPSKFFYDKKGSELFEQICMLPEYYPTRTEVSILKKFQVDLATYVSDRYQLVELGSGTSVKTRLVIDVLGKSQKVIEYLPIDISDILAESSERLLAEYDNLHITGIIDTYEGGLAFLKKFDERKNLVIFLGSSYGNFLPADGSTFLRTVHSAMKPGDLFLIGLDLVKDVKVLESAYNDSSGMTAEFNLNVLSRINDELDADFDLDNFEHHAIYNRQEQRIEMYLRSLVSQSAIISKSNQAVQLQKNELIHTEYSYKFTQQQIRSILQDAGFGVIRNWQDDMGYFSLTLVSHV